MRQLRAGLLLLALAGSIWFQFVNTASAREVGQSAADLFDSRPAVRLLFVGNSRMFQNDMPSMVRAIADSAGAPVKYRVRMWARPGETFPGHAASESLHRLIGEGWDKVILQADSGAHLRDEDRQAFAESGRSLIERAQGAGARAALIVNWTYGSQARGWDGEARAAYHSAIQSDYAALGASADAELINVGSVWRDMEGEEPDFALDTDGNHPSVHGTYLTALMVYGHLPNADVTAVTYVPEGMSATDAARIRSHVSDWVVTGSGFGG